MIKIDYPPFQPRLQRQPNQDLIFDEWRKKWVVLTPEEWVRQNFLQFLVQVKKYPATLIAIEKQVPVGELLQRFDIVVYNRNGIPWMLVECKEMNVPITEAVLQQALRYQGKLQSKFITVTNGTTCFLFESTGGQLKITENFPDFPIS
jgi:hypothetical protein